MKIVQKYYLKEFLKLLLLIASGLAALFALIELIDKMDVFLPHGPPVWKLAFYWVLSMPRYLLYLLPTASLVSGLYVFSQALRTNETVAVKAAGGRLVRLMAPFIFTGLLLSLFSFVLGEFTVPAAAKKIKSLTKSITKKTGPSIFAGGRIWLVSGDGSIVNIDLYMKGGNTARGVSIFRLDPGRGFYERVEAPTANYTDTWTLYNATVYDVGTGAVTRHRSLREPGIAGPALLEEEMRKPEEMGFKELGRYIARLKAAGISNHGLYVDLHSKASYHIVNLFMLVVGISIPARRSMGGLVAAAVGVSIGLAYWFAYTMSLSMGYTGVLGPVVAAWLVPLISGCVAFYLFWRLPE